METIDLKISDVQRKLDKKMNSKFENLPGYHAETVGDKVSATFNNTSNAFNG